MKKLFVHFAALLWPIFLAAVACLCVIALTGCGTAGNRAVPSSVIHWDAVHGTADAVLPKDNTLESLSIVRSGSNVTVEVRGLKASNSPEVVAAAYAGQVQAMQAQLQTLQQGFLMLPTLIQQGLAGYLREPALAPKLAPATNSQAREK